MSRNTQSRMQPNRGGSAASPASVADARRDKRIHVAVPVKLFLDPASDGQLCCTFEISMIGARLMAASGVSKVGQIVWLQRNNKRAKFRVMWVGEPGTSHENQVGVETMEPANMIWENELKLRILSA
jgi:hypothetical protein